MKRLFVVLGQNSPMRKLVVTSLMVVVVLCSSFLLSGCQTKQSNYRPSSFVYQPTPLEIKRGQFSEPPRNGYGKTLYATGGQYDGEFQNRKRHGIGTYLYPNGDKFFGQFKNGQKHGLGIFTYEEGTVVEGFWEKDIHKYKRKVTSNDIYKKSPPPQVRKTPEQIARKPKPRPSPSSKSGSTGSGFFVSKLGHVITNAHVVRNCGSITVGDNAKKQVTVTLLETDKRNDLALLKVSSTQMASADTKSLISKLGLKLVPTASEGLLRSDDVELGEDVLVSGYPYGDIYSNTIKVTKGIVSASRGLGDDRGQFQMDAAVQPGNSGGPIYDAKGNIVGVVVAQLNKLKFAKAMGSLPENVNFGIKASTVRQFLTSSGLPTKWSQRSQSMSTKELAKVAKNQTVMVVCHR
jgi:S1-C subfamily serine protease